MSCQYRAIPLDELGNVITHAKFEVNRYIIVTLTRVEVSCFRSTLTRLSPAGLPVMMISSLSELEFKDKFCNLRDMLDADGGAEEYVVPGQSSRNWFQCQHRVELLSK